MPKRCRSNCTVNKSISSCEKADKCSYTNGAKRKFCRLSSKYRMNPPECNITRKFLKREKGPAEKIRRFVENRHSTYKNRTRKHQSEIFSPTPPLLADANRPSDEEIKKLANKVHTRRIQRFMKKVDPNKRRARFLNGVCSDSGVCIAFGKETKTIKKHFDNFVSFKHVKSLRAIGKESANGFVKEVEYEHGGYKSHAVLKSSTKEDADNLYYEYLVGKFLNKQMEYFPVFLETYGMYQYDLGHVWADMKKPSAKPSLLNSISLLHSPKEDNESENIMVRNSQEKYRLKQSCLDPLLMCLLIQHISGAETLGDKCKDLTFVLQDLLSVLFQIYHTLHFMNDTFTHNDLHVENVLVYEPVKDSYIHYFYHFKDGSVDTFKSPYIPKIIDYGRCYYDYKRPISVHDPTNNSKSYYDFVCATKECDPYGYYPCGSRKGYGSMNPIRLHSASKPNQSQDLRLLDMLLNGYKYFGPSYSKMRDNIKKTKDIHSLIDKVVFDHTFYTKEVLDSGLSKSKINNVTDAFLEIRKLMRHPDNMELNNLVYSVYKRKLLGEMHVYDDRPLEFIPA